MKEWRNMSVEELLDMEINLQEKANLDEPAALIRLAELYRFILSKIMRNRDYSYLVEITKKKLTKILINYGTYMKASNKNEMAKKNLTKVLKYKDDIPIVHYRLGFLAYEEADYLKATEHLKKAIDLNRNEKDQFYKLNERQNYYAHLYLTNSALYIAKSANDKLETLENEQFEKLPKYETSPLFNVITKIEQYLNANGYLIVTKEGKKYASKEEVNDLIDSNEMNLTLICYFVDGNYEVIFRGRSRDLQSRKQAEMLRYILLHGTEESPITKFQVQEIFESKGTIPNNTFNTAMIRLKNKLKESLNLPFEFLIKRKDVSIDGNKTTSGYFYTGEMDYILIYRSDYRFDLDN